MDVPTSEALIKPMTSSENLIKPVPKPFSIEALMSDSGPKKTNPIPWNNIFNNPPIHQHHHHHHINKDTDSDGSIDMDIVQDLSNRRCDKDGKLNIIHDCMFKFDLNFNLRFNN